MHAEPALDLSIRDTRMVRNEIGHEDWPAFLDAFSRRHRGWLIDVGLINTELLDRVTDVDAHLMNRDAVFSGLVLESDGRGERLNLMLAPPAHATHAVDGPRRVYLETNPDGAEQGLRVDDDGGRSLLLRFRASSAPESVNGLMQHEC